MKTYQASKRERLQSYIMVLPLLLSSVILTLLCLHQHLRWPGAIVEIFLVLLFAMLMLLLLRYSWGIFNGMVVFDAEGVAVRRGKHTERMRWADVKAVSSLDDAWVLEDSAGRQLKVRCPTRDEGSDDFFDQLQAHLLPVLEHLVDRLEVNGETWNVSQKQTSLFTRITSGLLMFALCSLMLCVLGLYWFESSHSSLQIRLERLGLWTFLFIFCLHSMFKSLWQAGRQKLLIGSQGLIRTNGKKALSLPFDRIESVRQTDRNTFQIVGMGEELTFSTTTPAGAVALAWLRRRVPSERFVALDDPANVEVISNRLAEVAILRRVRLIFLLLMLIMSGMAAVPILLIGTRMVRFHKVATEGISVLGTITRHERRVTPLGLRYVLVYRFVVDGKTYQGRSSVSPSYWQQAKDGASADVLYVSQRPVLSHLKQSIAMQVYRQSIIVFVVPSLLMPTIFTFGLLWIFRKRMAQRRQKLEAELALQQSHRSS